MWKSLCVVCTVLVYFAESYQIFNNEVLKPSGGSDYYYNLLLRVNDALGKTINFVANSEKNLNIDGFYGCTLGVGHIAEALKLPMPDELRSRLELQIKFLKKTIAIGKSRLKPTNIMYIIFNELFTEPNVWQRHINFQTGFLNTSGVNIPRDIKTFEQYETYTQISPKFQEFASDFCFFDLIKSAATNQFCPVSQDCWNMELLEPNFYPSYNVSHRLLYLVIADTIGCQWNREYMFQKEREFCSFMYWESNLMQSLKEPTHREYFDLFLEQTTLCSLFGFEEFLKPDWMEMVVDMQGPTGCYLPRLHGGRRRKRESNIISDGCEDHTTGLGLASLALYNRYLVEKLFQ